MRSLVLIIISVIFISTSIWTLYDAFTPKVGPIGNGVDTSYVYFQFTFLFFLGICFLITAMIMIFSDERKKLRYVYIQINIVWYVTFIGVLVFVLINWNGLKEINSLLMYIILVIALFFTSLIHSYRIRTLIKEGEI